MLPFVSAQGRGKASFQREYRCVEDTAADRHDDSGELLGNAPRRAQRFVSSLAHFLGSHRARVYRSSIGLGNLRSTDLDPAQKPSQWRVIAF
jgi:hypothetical protein